MQCESIPSAWIKYKTPAVELQLRISVFRKHNYDAGSQRDVPWQNLQPVSTKELIWRSENSFTSPCHSIGIAQTYIHTGLRQFHEE